MREKTEIMRKELIGDYELSFDASNLCSNHPLMRLKMQRNQVAEAQVSKIGDNWFAKEEVAGI